MPALTIQPGNKCRQSDLCCRKGMVPAVAARQNPISQAAKTASPKWLLAMLADMTMRVCWASALSTRGTDVKPTTHLCHRTCQPSQSDRCTAKAGGTCREDSPACARTPRSTPPPSLDRTCTRTGQRTKIKSNQIKSSNLIQAGAAQKLSVCCAGLL